MLRIRRPILADIVRLTKEETVPELNEHQEMIARTVRDFVEREVTLVDRFTPPYCSVSSDCESDAGVCDTDAGICWEETPE